jgi:YD repeat-containing protein
VARDITHRYDAAGNRASRVIDFDGSVTTETYALSSTSNRLASVADGSITRSLTYDASGNVITDDRGGGTVYTLVYADHNRLAEIKSGSTVLASYAYGAFGRRLVKTAGSTVTQVHFGRSAPTTALA